MQSSERLWHTLCGRPTDRAPIWLAETFMKLSPPGKGNGWPQGDIHFERVQAEVVPLCDNLEMFSIGTNRLLCTPRRYLEHISWQEGDATFFQTIIHTPHGPLTTTTKRLANVDTVWTVEYAIKDMGQLQWVLDIPDDNNDTERIDIQGFRQKEENLASQGLMTAVLDTPLISVSGLMHFEDFLVLCHTDPDLLRVLCDRAFTRIQARLQVALAAGIGPIYRIKGSEQTTPPMTSPQVYRDFVLPYEAQLISDIHSYDNKAWVHCHGRLRQILPMMLEAGIDMVDPVEDAPNGDISFAEAHKMVDGRMTLAGNIQYDDLENCDTKEIRSQVRRLFDNGSDHILVTPSSSPITFMGQRLADNYHHMVDEVYRMFRHG